MDPRKTFLGYFLSAFFFWIPAPVIFYIVSAVSDKIFALPYLMVKPYNFILCIPFLAFGLFWLIWSNWYMVNVGKGSPGEAFGKALEPTKKLIVTGPYAHTRNPMAFGFLCVLTSIAIFFRSISGLILLPILAILSRWYLKVFEERGLIKRFGQEYLEYRRCVPMLVPRIRKYSKVRGQGLPILKGDP